MSDDNTRQPRPNRSLDRALEALAAGRIVLGAASLAAPGALSRLFGITHSPEVAYLTRIYGSRAIVLGTSYLLADQRERDRLRLLSLGVDVSDTVTGTGHLLRRDDPRRGLMMLTALTGGYAALGAASAWSRHARA